MSKEQKSVVLIIPGQPGILKNSKKIVSIPLKGSKRCPNCKKFDKTFSKLLPSDKAERIKKHSVKELYRQWKHTAINFPIDVKMEFFVAWKSDGQADLSNLYQLPEDAMQAAGVIVDDNLIKSHDGSGIIAMCGDDDDPCPLRTPLKSGKNKGQLRDDCGAVAKCQFEKVVITITRAKAVSRVMPWSEEDQC